MPFAQAVSTTRARVGSAQRAPRELKIVTDSRTLRPGETFLALHGEQFDGHAYVADAVRKGAVALIVDRPQEFEIATLLVEDTKRAYMALAQTARQAFDGLVVAVTGSTGKTTTKYFLEQLLKAHFGVRHVLASEANENNEIGLSKLILAIESEHRIVVAEMGARHPGEIADLVDVAQPHFGVLTNIGEAHLEIFGSREQLAQTKWALFSGGARAILNARDPISRSRAAELPQPPLWFGTGEPEMPGVWLTDERTLLLTHGETPQKFAVAVPFPGEYNRENLAAALAAALLIGVPPAQLANSIPELSLPPGRYEDVALPNRPRLIYDAYNASPAGMIATLRAFAAEPAARRIAVLGSMAELGEESAALHERVGNFAGASSHLDALLVGGEFADALAAGAAAAGMPHERILRFEDNAQAARWLSRHATVDDVVLIKGSRKYRMEQIVETLRDGTA